MSARTLSELLIDIQTQVKAEKITFSELFELFHERGFGFFLFLFALPAALPIPAIGINAIIAIPLLLLTAQQAMGRHTIWIPKKMASKSLSKSKIDGFVNKASPLIKKIEFLVKPRLSFITQGIFSNLIGIMGFVMALAVSIPLPLTNTVPAFGIALMAIGVLMRDGFSVLGGALIGILWVSMLVFVTLYFGEQGIEIAKDFIKSFLP